MKCVNCGEEFTARYSWQKYCSEKSMKIKQTASVRQSPILGTAKIPIKFRGKRLDNGEYVYGDFVHSVPMSSFTGIIDEDGFVHEIKPDSQKQLVGYDSNGDEVYEDDPVVSSIGNVFVARLQPQLVHTTPFSEHINLDFSKFKLKEKKS